MNRLQAAEQTRKALQLFAASLPEEQALMVASVYDEWDSNKHPYKTGDWVRYGVDDLGDSRLYQVLQDHTSQDIYPPDTATSLYKRVGISEDGTPKWIQPVGATDAYKQGDIVEHNGSKWISDIDNNVWEPRVYGWTKQDSTSSGDTETDTPSKEVADFVQPTSSQDAYKKGDKVKYNGKIYESTMDNNVYSPDTYPTGWNEITE